MTTPQATNVDALRSGTELDGYLITGLIGQGGFGVVYVARDTRSNRTVAIKEFLPAAIAGRAPDGRIAPRSVDFANAFATGLKGFLREANLLAEFAHPALVAVHRAWEQNGTAYMAMQYYPGRTLRDVRARMTGSASEQQIQAWMSPVFEAVAELHAHRVIHRDVSPDNILVLPAGETVLLDLGAARQVLGGMTQALTTILKPGFAPIEQYVEDGSMEQGRWTDVYGLGAVIYFLATGKPPVPATSRIVRDSLLTLAEVAPAAGYAPALSIATARALSIRAIDRFKSISEFRSALGWAKTPRAMLPPTEVTTTTEPLTPQQVRAVTSPAPAPGPTVAAVPSVAPVAAPPAPRVAAIPVANPSRAGTSGSKPDAALGALRGKGAQYDAPKRMSGMLIAAAAVAILVVVGAVLALR